MDALMAGELVDTHRVGRGMRALFELRSARFEVAWRVARGYFLLTQALRPARSSAEAARQLRLARAGAAWARHAIAHRGRRVEGHYFLALNLAKVAEASLDLGPIRPAVVAARQAATLDERFDDAGPHVFLGKVFLSAPPWPMSVGNLDQAVRRLERALALAPRPLTRLFLAQAYYHDEQYARAEAELQRVMQNQQQLAPKWREEAHDYLGRIRRHRSK